MSKQKRWPTNAENYRLESIAKARRIREELRKAMNDLRPITDTNCNMLATEMARRVAGAATRIAEAFTQAAEIENLLEAARDGVENERNN